jgi:hypothetical protein
MMESLDLSFESACIFVVTKGPEVRHAWLVDWLYEGLKSFTKFSSNEHAGNNPSSLVGCTCDALAHFSYFDSEESLVLVDIQGKGLISIPFVIEIITLSFESGIDSASLPSNVRQKGEEYSLILYNSMIHR